MSTIDRTQATAPDGGVASPMRRAGTAIVVAVFVLVAVRAAFGTLWGLVSALAFLAAVVAVIDVSTSRRSPAAKLGWIVAIVLFPFLGTLVYWLAAREPARF